MTRYANVDKLVKAGYNMLSNDLELHDPIDWTLAELDGFVIEVPTPHGRLGDLDGLYKHIKAEWNPYGKPTIGFEDGKKVMKIIADTRTVIEAEE